MATSNPLSIAAGETRSGTPASARRSIEPCGANRYPTDLIDVWHLPRGDRLMLRPVMRQDLLLLSDLIRRSSAQTRYRRFHGAVNELPYEMLRDMTCVDYEHSLALVVTSQSAEGESIVADARYCVDAAGRSAELAIMVDDHWQRKGLGERAIRSLLRAARHSGLQRLSGTVLRSNAPMLALMRRFDFVHVAGSEDAQAVVVERNLVEAAPPA